MDKNYSERTRLFTDAKQVIVSDEIIDKAVECINKKLRLRKHDAPITIKKDGKEVLVCWVAKWGKMYDVTVMGYRFNYVTDNKRDIAKWCCQLAISEKNNEYKFVYGV